MHFDVFNGDADGICALLQLRLSDRRKSTLVTGVKRDIQLLKHVPVSEDIKSVTVLDISLEKNVSHLNKLLDKGINVVYCDHHRAGEIPDSKHLTTYIDTTPEICTSLLINKHLKGEHYLWAITGAFGDNLLKQAQDLAKVEGLQKEDTSFLKELGTLINYNGYGATLSDLHFDPKVLYQELYHFPNPLKLRNDEDSAFYKLKSAFDADWDEVVNTKAHSVSNGTEIYLLPNEPWARRISGTFGNWLTNQKPQKAIAVLSLNPNQESYTVSVRSPLINREGADDVCCQFPTGGGRKAAAGINSLPSDEVSRFIEIMESRFNVG